MARNTTIPAKQVEEEIQSYTHFLNSHVVFTLAFGETNADGEFHYFPNQMFERQTVDGVDYTELMSDKPHWSPQKPQGQFRKDDLWEAVYSKRANRPLGGKPNVV